jgi:TPR repeat protein
MFRRALNRCRNAHVAGKPGAALGFALILTSLHAAPAAESPAAVETAFDAIDRNDLVGAAAVLEPLAAGGDARAQAALSVILGSAQTNVRSARTATEWLEQAARLGVAAASLELGNRYYEGDGLPRDPREAFKSWRAAADAGLAQAQYNLGVAYALGIGIDRSPKDAAEWLQLAASNGNGAASFALGVLYGNGDLGERDYRAARVALERAAGSGHAMAQYHLGLLYEHGMGGPRDLLQSRRWLLAAASQDLDEAVAALQRISPNAPAADGRADEDPAQRIFGPSWTRRQNPDHYTLQIASGYDEEAIRDALMRYVPNLDSAYFKFSESGNQPYIAIVGSFTTIREASAALQTLPDPIQTNNPWIRRFGKIQERLDTTPGR